MVEGIEVRFKFDVGGVAGVVVVVIYTLIMRVITTIVVYRLPI